MEKELVLNAHNNLIISKYQIWGLTILSVCFFALSYALKRHYNVYQMILIPAAIYICYYLSQIQRIRLNSERLLVKDLLFPASTEVGICDIQSIGFLNKSRNMYARRASIKTKKGNSLTINYSFYEKSEMIDLISRLKDLNSAIILSKGIKSLLKKSRLDK